jgi:predicted phage terminase large subunit-like protein
MTPKQQAYLAPRIHRLLKLRAEDTLADFVRSAWSILEPVTVLEWNWHLDLICEYLTLIRDKKLRETFGDHIEGIIVNVPPRSMKSILITVLFPAWVWIKDPARRFMSVSYAEKLSTAHSVARRDVMKSPWYQSNWGEKFFFAHDQDLKTAYQNNHKGTMFSTAMQAVATGLGGDILIFDDPLNPDQSLSDADRNTVNVRFDNTFRTRINDHRTGSKIIVMQRLHESDLTGHLLEKEKDRWLHLKLPAIGEIDERWVFPISGKIRMRKPGELLWPARLPKTFLDSMKGGGADGQGGMGSWAFAGQFQQNPAPLEGGLIKRKWIQYYQRLPEQFELMVGSWDCTFKDEVGSDFVAGQYWGRSGAKYYMLPYRVYDRMDFPRTRSAVLAGHQEYPRANAVLVEDKANGPAIISELRKDIPGMLAIEPYGGKFSRAQAMSPLWEAGSVLLPDPKFFPVPWLEAYIHNICTFPKAAHDDDMDSTSQALNWMRINSFGLLEVWRAQAEAMKKKAEEDKQPKTEQEVTKELGEAQLAAAALTVPAAETMKALGASNTLGLMPKKPEAPKAASSGCPKCGSVLSKYQDFSTCNNCGWNSNQPS